MAPLAIRGGGIQHLTLDDGFDFLREKVEKGGVLNVTKGG